MYSHIIAYSLYMQEWRLLMIFTYITKVDSNVLVGISELIKTHDKF
jgi:hypothetical protein